MHAGRTTIIALAAVVAGAVLGAVAWLGHDAASDATPASGDVTLAATDDADDADAASARLATPEPPGARDLDALVRPARVEPLELAEASPADDAPPPLWGIVRDRETLRPIEGAVVAFVGRRDGCVTGPDGRYRLARPSGEFAAITARHPDYVSEPKTWRRAQHDGRIDFVLQHGVLVQLTCVDRDSGRPIAGVELRESEDGDALQRADDGGRLALRVLPGREAGWVFAHEDHASLWWLWDGSQAVDGVRADVPLRRPAIVDARVTDDRGRPLAGAWLRVDKPDGLHFRLDVELLERCGLPGRARDVEPSRDLRSDAQGMLRLPLMPWPSDYRLTARCDGYAGVEAPPVALRDAGRHASVDFTLHAAGRVQGRVRRNGAPLAQTSVHCLDADGRGLGSARTDDEGGYLVPDVLPGAVHVELRDPLTNALRQREVVVEAGRASVCDFDFEADFAPIGGHVRWTTGEPAAGVFVNVWSTSSRFSAHTRTEADGSWSVDVPDDGVYDVSISAAGTGGVWNGIPPGKLDLENVLAAQGTLRLRLVDAASGETLLPTSRGTWFAWRTGGIAPYHASVPRGPDATGMFAAPVTAGTVDITIDLRGQGYLPLELPGLDVLAGEREPPLELRLERGRELVLRFVTENGLARKPSGHVFFALPRSRPDSVRLADDGEQGASTYSFDGATLRLRVDDGPSGCVRVTIDDRDATATLRGLSEGRWLLRAFPEDLALRPDAIDLPRDAGRRIDVAVAPKIPR